MAACRWAFLLCGFLLASPIHAGGPATAPADKVCVAVLEPEVQADLPADQRKALAGSLDTVLTESLAGRKEFTLVDRQALDKVLAEKTAGAAGLSKIAPADVAAPLRPFWSAGVLVCPSIRIDLDPTGKSQTVSVIVEAVLTQTGQVVAECVVRGDWKAGQGAPMLKAAALEEFWSQIGRTLAQRAGRPLVEVLSPGQLTSSLTRLAWMRDDLDDYLRNHVAAKGSVELLVPRHPLFTKEERLLRVMGLSAVKGLKGDSSAGLTAAAAPDGRVAAELIEQPVERVAFEKTPITIRLTWSHDGKSVVSEPIKGTVERYETLRTTAAKWLDEQVASLAPPRADAEAARDESACKRLAAEEVAAVGQMLSADVVTGLGFFHTDPAENALGARAFMHAARAAHLDPTNRQAARLVAMLVHCAYYAPDHTQRQLAAYDRAIVECQRYIERFKVTVIQDEKLYYRLMWAAERAAELEAGSRERLVNLTLTPLDDVYRYARTCAFAAMEVGMSWTAKREWTPDIRLANLWAGAARVRDWAMLDCPLDELDGELAYWRKFWAERVETVVGEVPPWEVVLVGYYTRKHDWASLRKTYNELAGKCPIRNSRAWTQAKVDIHLKVAGDPDWQTWQPEFSKDAPQQYRLDMPQCDAFFRRLIPQPSQAHQVGHPYEYCRLAFPSEVIGAGSPSAGPVESMLADSAGHLFVTNTLAIDRLDTATLIRSAEQGHRVASTNQLAKKFAAASVAPGWQGQVAAAILEKRFNDALAVIDDQLGELGEVSEKSPAGRQTQWTDLMLWQGLVQARAGFLDEASDLYRKVAASPMSDGPAKAMARLNRITTLYRAKRWQDMLDEADAFGKQFPDLKATPGPSSIMDALPGQLADAARKREQATTNPDLQPVDTHAPRRAARVVRIKPPNATTRPADADGSIGMQLIAEYKSNLISAVASAKSAGKDAVPGLMQGLKSSDAPTRLAAATLLRILANEGRNRMVTASSGQGRLIRNDLQDATEGAINDLVAAAQDDPAVREEAFMVAGTMGSPAKAMVPLLMKALRDEGESSRLHFLAANAISSVAPDEPGLVAVLVSNAKNPDWLIRSSAIRAIGNLGKRAVAAKPTLAEALKDSNKDVRSNAISAVHAIGLPADEEVALLVPLIKDPEKSIRQWALYSLGGLGPAGKAALPAFVEALKDPEKWVQENAIRAIGRMGKAALPVIADLKAFKQPGIHPRLQETADFAIKAIERSEQ